MWKDANIVQDSILYTINGKEHQKLYSVFNEYGKLGYMITDINSKNLIEFALGESPYDGIISSINKGTSSSKIKLIINGANNHLFTEDEFKTIKNIHSSKYSKTNSLNSDNRKFNTQLDTNINSINSYQITNIISGVPYELNNGTTPGCGPVSAINLIKFWDSNGYPNLVTSNDTKQSMYNKLYNYMGSFVVPNSGGQVATLPMDYIPGIYGYLEDKGYSITGIIREYLNKADYSILKNEVDNRRPGTILYNDNLTYGLHYVTFVGYSQYIDISANYYIIHDLWSTSNVYRSWDYDIDSNYIWKMYTWRN